MTTTSDSPGARDTDPRHDDRVSGFAILLGVAALALVVLVVQAVILPNRVVERAGLPESRSFRVDEAGLHYTWLDGQMELQSARELATISPHHRAGVAVWHETWGEPDPDRVYIADLARARAGERRDAALVSRLALRARGHAIEAGAVTGELTVFLASEVAAFSPTSDRQRSARQAAELLESLELHDPMANEKEAAARIRERIQIRMHERRMEVRGRGPISPVLTRERDP